MRVVVAVPSDGDPAHRAVARGLVRALRRRGVAARAAAGFTRLEGPADVVHAHVFSRALRPADLARLPRGAALVLTHQGASVALQDDPRALARALRRADAATAVCPAGGAELRAMVPGVRVSVVPNGADPGPLARRTRAGGHGEVLTVGRLAAYKGLDLLALALAELAARGVRRRWTALGPDQTGGRLAAFARRLGLDARFPGAVGRAAVRRALGRAAVFVQPSRSEGSALALVEAMAAGLPVVASRAGGNAALLRGAGVLVAPGDPRALALALEGVLLRPARARRLGALARRRARRFTWDAAAAAYLRLYAQARRGKSPSRRLDSAAQSAYTGSVGRCRSRRGA